MSHLPRTLAVFLLPGLLLAGVARAQAPSTRPAQPPQSADQMLDRMLQPSAPAAAIQPAPGAGAEDRTSGGAAVAPDAPRLTVMREGSYIVDRLGRVAPTADGQQMEFIFESDGQALRDPPVIVLPSLKLMDLEWARETKGPDTRFRITGMVTEYKGRNYVLLDKVVVVPEK